MKQNRLIYDDCANFGVEYVVDIEYFHTSVLQNNSRDDFIKVLKKCRFLALAQMQSCLKRDYDEVEEYVSLNDLLNHWNVDYVDVFKKRLEDLGWNREMLIKKCLEISYGENGDFDTAVGVIYDTKDFFCDYKKIKCILPSPRFLFKLFQIDFNLLLKKKKILKYCRFTIN